MQKFLALISFSVLLAISIGCDRIQEVVTPQQQEETLKIGFVVAGETRYLSKWRRDGCHGN